MENRIVNGIVDLKERQKVMTEANVYVLEKVKNILVIDGTDLITIQMCADYFEVPISTIKMLINRHQDEFEENGLKLYSRKEINDVFNTVPNVTLEKVNRFKDSLKSTNVTLDITNRGLTFMTKRTILNMGMLLRDSEIAKELRRRILDIVHDSEKGQGDINAITNEIDEEKELKIKYVDAMMSGNITLMNEINAKLFDLKNKRIEELQPKANWFDEFMGSEGCYTSTQVAKILHISSAMKLNQTLNDRKIIYKQGKNWLPYATTDDTWYRMIVGNANEHSYSQLKFTPKGIYEISKILDIESKRRRYKISIKHLTTLLKCDII